MALGTYSELKTAIARWARRTDLTADLPDFIALAEARIKTVLQARLQDTSGTITTEAGTVTASLPSTLLRITSLSIANVMPSIDYLSPDQFNQQYAASYAGPPENYTVIGDLIYFGPTPDAVYSVAATFQADVIPLTDAAPTNSLLTKWPNVYLFGSLVEAARLTKDKKSQDEWDAEFLTAIAAVNLLDWHTGGQMRVRTDVRM